jgi:hypothetical protein
MVAKVDSHGYLQRTMEQEMMQVRAENQRMLEAMNSLKTEEVRGESRKN